MGNVCTITKCRRKREHTIDSFQNPVSFQENGMGDEKITSPPESKVSSESGMVCFLKFWIIARSPSLEEILTFYLHSLVRGQRPCDIDILQSGKIQKI